jgi:endonuclease YncB( thermonuclease family)
MIQSTVLCGVFGFRTTPNPSSYNPLSPAHCAVQGVFRERRGLGALVLISSGSLYYLLMAAESFIAISGTLKLLGYEPDGDSVRFIPDSKTLISKLAHSARARFSADGSLQLRLEAIDAPETHFEAQAQPLGVSSRSSFLRLLGFGEVNFAPSGKVISATPATLPATILSKMIEVNGRPVAYLFVGDARNFLTSRAALSPGAALLDRSLNAQMLAAGAAYPTLYTSTPTLHRDLFISLANKAKTVNKGVWSHDQTAKFTLKNQASLGPHGQQLILPKLFRRCTDYLKAKNQGFSGDLPAWLETATSRGFTENDAVWSGGTKTTLSKLVSQQSTTIRFSASLLDLVFVEK